MDEEPHPALLSTASSSAKTSRSRLVARRRSAFLGGLIGVMVVAHTAGPLRSTGPSADQSRRLLLVALDTDHSVREQRSGGEMGTGGARLHRTVFRSVKGLTFAATSTPAVFAIAPYGLNTEGRHLEKAAGCPECPGRGWLHHDAGRRSGRPRLSRPQRRRGPALEAIRAWPFRVYSLRCSKTRSSARRMVTLRMSGSSLR